jgi:hypothetical protein
MRQRDTFAVGIDRSIQTRRIHSASASNGPSKLLFGTLLYGRHSDRVRVERRTTVDGVAALPPITTHPPLTFPGSVQCQRADEQRRLFITQSPKKPTPTVEVERDSDSDSNSGCSLGPQLHRLCLSLPLPR